MKLSRRDFLELLGCSAAAVSLPALAGCQSGEKDTGSGGGGGGDEPQPAPAKPAPKPLPSWLVGEIQAKAALQPVVWLQGQSCSGCSVSLLNADYPGIAEVLTEIISLEFHQTVMTGAGDTCLSVLDYQLEKNKGTYVLLVEGSIPTGDMAGACTIGERDGKLITMEEWVKKLGPHAKAVVAIGACATFGGIPAAKPNPTKAKKVTDLLPGATVINIPGCPSHPDWIVGTVAHVLLFGIPELDEHLRPKMFFGRSLHEQCERRADFDEGNYAKFFGDKGCLYELGCKGPDAMCDASIRQWNSKVSWCVRAGGACIGCVEPTFPDHDGDGLYVKKPYDRLRELPGYKGTRRSREA